MEEQVEIASSEIECQVEGCRWSIPHPNEESGLRTVVEAIAALHVLLRHPAVFVEITGRHPEVAVADYANSSLNFEEATRLATVECATETMESEGLVTREPR